MTAAAPSRPARSRRTAHDRVMRANRIFARMLEGQAYGEIAAAEGLTVRRVRMIVQEALGRRDIEPREEYARVQVARLDSALRLVEGKVADGKLSAVSPLIRLVDQLDRYQGRQRYEPPGGCIDRHRGVAGQAAG
jgi:hypothetical protein